MKLGKYALPIDRFEQIPTPFYYYDTRVLADTLDEVKAAMQSHDNYHMHYAVKANTNPKLLQMICKAGFGADCVSGGEIQACIAAGFPADKIVFAGVGKADWEIELGLDAGIFSFNVESIPELEVINGIAAERGVVAKVAFRINPNVGAHTHANITTGLAENKFGIALEDIEKVVAIAKGMNNVEFIGLHFHIGSQILEMDDFAALANRINEIQERLDKQGVTMKNINVGGGLGIDYQDPEGNTIPDFKSYFDTYSRLLKLRPGQQLHFELGRAIVGQCGVMVARTLYVKEATVKKFVIVDAGFTELIRPAFYDAYHKIANLNSNEEQEKYDVVGPICESSDVFGKERMLAKTKRGDLIGFFSAGAYGEVMASQYNCRQLPRSYTDTQLV
ncbi:MAG: diaminopimelate decarboxylase [Prevotella sp.]|nr:diaminopimelate decarboxylase [Prevotella sp.]